MPFATTVLIYSQPKNVPSSRVEVQGLPIWPVIESLCMTGPRFFVNNPREAEIALAMVRIASDLLMTLLAGDMMVTAAARLVGAFQFIKRLDDADRIVNAFAQVSVTLKPMNPSLKKLRIS